MKKLTLDIDAEIRERLDNAVRSHGFGSQRKIVEIALNNELRKIGF